MALKASSTFIESSWAFKTIRAVQLLHLIQLIRFSTDHFLIPVQRFGFPRGLEIGIVGQTVDGLHIIAIQFEIEHVRIFRDPVCFRRFGNASDAPLEAPPDGHLRQGFPVFVRDGPQRRFQAVVGDDSTFKVLKEGSALNLLFIN